MSNLEQTLSIIKPDAVERNLENQIKEIFKHKGFKIVKEKKPNHFSMGLENEEEELVAFSRVSKKDLFIKTDVSGACTQNIFHFTEESILSAKKFLEENNINIRK